MRRRTPSDMPAGTCISTCLGFRVQGSGVRIGGSGLRVEAAWDAAKSLELRAGSRVRGFEIRISGSGFRVYQDCSDIIYSTRPHGYHQYHTNQHPTTPTNILPH
jgi:hypothetical protein